METSIQIGLWIIVFLVFAIFLSLDIFYIKKLIENRRENKSSAKKNTSTSTTEQRQKIKSEILLDLEKKLEAL
ncbi:hypothetical protein [uncultured Mucilaginibacter sp.]|uniref:hypothetical protein n=1 Tax=uncultured Mucilaginibacter sp. TaxID=797541 RepID=UPI00262D6729|nr:hypothetical protein [uncultured Mucilaginibacter sp.]